MKGKFYGVGVGPGDPELITLKAQRILQEVDIIFVPVSKLEKRSLAFSIVSPFLSNNKSIVEVHMPMTQDETVLEQCWQEAAERINAYLQQGKDVAFLTLGDPSLFSTYTYIMARIKQLDAELVIETIPGITSLAAAAARINQPLSEGEERLVIIPAINEAEDLRANLATHHNLVLMKVSKQFPQIVSILEEEGRLQDAVMVTRCGQPEEQIIWNLQEATNQKVDYMSVILVKGGSGQ